MKVLHLASEYPAAKVYGLGRFLHGLARAQAAQGDEVHVLTNSQGGSEDGVLRDGVHVHRIAFPNPPRPADGIGEVLQFQACLTARFLSLRSVLQGADVVASHDWLVAPAAREVARALSCPLVTTFHDEATGKHFGRLDADARFVRDMEALTAHDANHVIANSLYVAEQLQRHLRLPAERVTAIPGGIDPGLLDLSRPELLPVFRRALQAGEDELLALYVGRLDPEKGLETLGEALELALERVPRLRVLVAGSGKHEDALRARLSPRADRVRFLGYVRGEALAYLYRAVDVVLVPSVYEPFGLVALEAMLAGRAVVAAASGGLREIVRHEEDGLLIPPGDAGALSQAVVRLAEDPALGAGLGARAAERVAREHAWTEIAKRTRAVYAGVLGQPCLPCSSAPPAPTLQLVSVTMATKDAPVHAETALRSLFQRTDYPALEAIVVDDGSSAAALERLRRVVGDLQAEGREVRLLEGPLSGRFSAAQNLAIQAARGHYVCLLNDDTEVPVGSEGWLRALVWLLEEQGAGTVTPVTLLRDGRIYCAGAFGGGGHKLGEAPDAPELAREPRPTEWNNMACLLTRRSAFAEAGPLSEEPAHAHYGSDREWCLRLTARTGLRHWVHPVRLFHYGGEAVRNPAAPHGASHETRLPVSVVVVAWGCLPWTRACVESVLAHTPRPFELVLVDNGSPDGTGAYFRELRDRLGGTAPVQVLTNPENLGYPVGANQGIRAARGRDVVVLNNDARVRAGWLEALLQARRSRPGVGIVAPKVLNEDGTVQSAGGVLHHPDGGFTIPGADEDRLAPPVNARRELTSAGGPCMLLTRELLEAVGAFDEAYSPGYFEDSDLCLRAREAGFSLVYEPGAEVIHRAKVTSSAVAREGKLDVWGRFQENERRFRARWGERLAADEADRRVAEEPERPRRIVLCYGASRNTTAVHCEAALRRAHRVLTAGPGQELDLGEAASAAELVDTASRQLGGEVDLLLAVEGVNYLPPGLEEAPCRTAWWAIDSHLHARDERGWHFAVAPRFDLVAVAQRDHVQDYARRGVRAVWLPLACDPAVHRQPTPPSGRDLDVVFVGNVLPIHERRRRLLDRLRARFALVERQGVWREDMARLFARARVVFNCSLAGDLNMRVFEGLAAGALVLTDRIGNGFETLFAPGEHLAVYADDDALERELARWLADPTSRESVAARGQRLALGHHTYDHRMRELVRLALAVPARRTQAEVRR